MEISWASLFGLLLGSSLLGTFFNRAFDRSDARDARLRDGYAEATQALISWGTFPLRVSRRTDDDPDTLKALENLGADATQKLAYYIGWVAADSPALGDFYSQLVQILRAEVSYHARKAWERPPVSSGRAMNLLELPADEILKMPGTTPAEWELARFFSSMTSSRVGWPRLWVSERLISRRIQHRQLVERAVTLMSTQSIRILTDPGSLPVDFSQLVR